MDGGGLRRRSPEKRERTGKTGVAPVSFLPVSVAVKRGHPNAAAIFILNLLLGWTFLGWVAALVWSFTAVDVEDDK